MKGIRGILFLFLMGASGLLWAVDINTASEAELMSIKGIGPVKAERIVAARADGVFCSLEEFARRVKGIGKKTIQVHRDQFTLGDVKDQCSKRP
uniref:Competence protein ComEA n=1 Tax=Candidatus Kentrum sp. MB TaxID=2138164 RepID=A0A451BA11_9GAMM|nr:MAG: competence protein ComEA [Candidatus Kentron sp. MB]VFK27218.1 MAG: competence protein ComEA [Candidatus Kentron sp. MB]VFK75097.1 MAG: competence protein ComEA [Candidatus Kentron sp. MB]